MNKFIDYMLQKINSYSEENPLPYRTFGIFAIITYPTYWLIWSQLTKNGYENIELRLIVVLLGIPLIFYKNWPAYLKKYLPIYWYITLCYSLPFLFSFLLLKNHFSEEWVLNAITVVTLIVLLIDLIPLLIILPIGILGGTTLYYFTDGTTYLPSNWSTILITYFSVIIFGALFAHQKQTLKLLRDKHKEQERIAKTETELRQSIMVLAGSIAHDLRTPLLVVRSLAEVTGMAMPKLLFAYTQAQIAKLDNLEKISVMHLKKLPEIPADLSQLVTEMNDYITISLKSLTQVLAKDLKPEDLVICSADYCIKNTIRRYPFLGKERNLIHSDTRYQFEFKGNPVLVFRMLSNLIKNDLEQIQKNQQGEIFISTRDAGNMNQICVKDTAGGVTPEIAKNLFGGYKTTKAGGTGVGLAFCKLTMETFQGTITAHCIENDYIEFILSFPKPELN